MPGPSPRAWGSPHLRGHPMQQTRSIPTCVGLTCSSRWLDVDAAVHPHVRGAHRATALARRFDPGPSPRAWGSREHPLCVSRVTRSIPTCVGLTRPHRLAVPRMAVHPHVRGAHPGQSVAIRAGRGPSPRAWGSLRGDRGAPGR
ncbi:conserved hypothetical protein [Thermobifida fusca YX]|nr:conserved hypothetical protein [Thermobifida fusca YX]